MAYNGKSLVEKLKEAQLKASTNFLIGFQMKMDSGEIVRPEQILYDIMVDEGERASDRIAAASKLMSSYTVKPPIQKEITLSMEENELTPERKAELLARVSELVNKNGED